MFNFLRKTVAEPKVLRDGFGEYNTHTPDYYLLEQREFHLFLICDEMMNGHWKHDLLEPGSLYCSQAFTMDPYILLRQSNGKQATVLTLEPQVGKPGLLWQRPMAPVRGELYALRPYQILELDKYKENGVLFHRKRVPIDIPYREKYETEAGGIWHSDLQHDNSYDVWMYFAHYDKHYEHWHMTSAERIAASSPLVQAGKPYYFHR